MSNLKEIGDVTSVPETGSYINETSVCKGAGDIHSNVLDLLRFDRAFPAIWGVIYYYSILHTRR